MGRIHPKFKLTRARAYKLKTRADCGQARSRRKFLAAPGAEIVIRAQQPLSGADCFTFT